MNIYGDAYDRYVTKLKQAGVRYLENATERIDINGIKCRIFCQDIYTTSSKLLYTFRIP